MSAGVPEVTGSPAPGPGSERFRLHAATVDFEAVFIQEMLKVMRSTVPEGGLLDGGRGEEMFTAMLDEHVSRVAAERGRHSLADTLYRRFVDRVRQ